MKILMIGLGSIGQRHLRNLKRIFGDEHEILAFRTRRLQQTFSDAMQIRENVNLEEEYGIRVFTDLGEALKEQPDVAFITNITECAKAGCSLFIEKPLSDTMEHVEELKEAVKTSGKTVWMGFQNRYHVCVKEAADILRQGSIGPVISAEFEYGERLTTMHTYEDYRQTYMARSDMGGGPVLNLLMHDLDCIRYLIGEPSEVSAFSYQRSGLEIDVEDSASAIFNVRNASNPGVMVYAHTDFLQFPPSHAIKVVCEKGRIEIDMLKASIRIIQDGEVVKDAVYDSFQRNDMFIEEMKDFFRCVRDGSEPFMGLEDGIASLKMAVAMKKSSAERRFVKIEEIE